jgi:hydroxymethylglutaryl-CoA reductase (NADPH)
MSRPNPREDPAAAPRLPSATDHTEETAARRRELLAAAGYATTELAGAGAGIGAEALAGSIEGFVGFAQVPVGVFGPLRVHGEHVDGEVVVPLATSEGALVSSLQHVANLLGRAGGISARCTDQGVQRAPCFSFGELAHTQAFVAWLADSREVLAGVVAEGSRFCRLRDLRTSTVGDTVHVLLSFATGDAAGQNMVTLATQAVCTRILDESPVKPVHWQLEANWSGDKKASQVALQSVRGRRATALATLPDKLCRRYFRAPASALAQAWSHAETGALLAGTVGSQANVANALAGLFIACGQDVACVAEASVGITQVRLDEAGDLRVSVTLPNLIVGTVGGGTYLPTARECLQMLGCAGDGHGPRLAEICAAVALCGEVALNGAMAGGSFAAAHAALGRKREE